MNKKCILIAGCALIISFLGSCNNTPSNSNKPNVSTNNSGNVDATNSRGKNLAKLLLARERLDSQLLRNDVNIFEKESSSIEKHNKRIDYLFGESIVVGEKMYWSNFDEYNNSFSYFNSITSAIIYSSEEGAKLIDEVKSTITELDKWIEYEKDGMYNKYYLSVSADTDILYKVNDYEISICKHYINDIGQTVYEIYLEQENVVQRMKYIPNMRYEFSEKIDDGHNKQEKYFVADYSKGYWEVSEIDPIDDRYNIMYYVMKNDICYSIYNDPNETITTINVMSADVKTDIFSYDYLEDITNVTIKLSGFNGIDYIEAPINDVRYLDDTSLAYTHSQNTALMSKNNTYLYGGYKYNDMITVSSIMVGASHDGYIPTLQLRVNSSDSNEVWNEVESFLNDSGLECKRELNVVLNGVKKIDVDSQDMINYYTVNGYALNNNESVSKAVDIEKNIFNTLKNDYNQIKGDDIVSYEDMVKVDEELSFPSLENTKIDNSQIENKIISIDKISHTISDNVLLDENENYHIEIALVNQENDSVLSIYSSNEIYKYNNESTFTLEANNIEFEMPNVSEGTYRIISYIATSDGIRVSDYKDIIFSNVNDNLDEIEIIKDEEGIVNIEYAKPNDYTITYETETQVNYHEFYDAICKMVFEYGSISSNIEKLMDNTYVEMNKNSSITEGIYRIGYTINDGETETTGYIYIEYNIINQ